MKTLPTFLSVLAVASVLLAGVAAADSSLVLPTQLQNAAIFVFFLLIVTLRPQGLFGRVTERT